MNSLILQQAISLWQQGEVIAFPTETVYGLGADATNSLAVAKIFAIKNRPHFNPLILHTFTLEAIEEHIVVTEAAQKLAEAFWPGPLTIVAPKQPHSLISPLVSAGGNTLAIRVPAHEVALELLQAIQRPIAAPSANRSGYLSPTQAAHVRADLGDAIPLIIEGGASQVGVESTILDLTTPVPTLLRPGGISKEALEEVIGPVHLKGSAQAGPLKAPGQLESHYAPGLSIRLNVTQPTETEALLGFGPIQPSVKAAKILNLSSKGDVLEAAANLFSMLHELDKPEFSAIAVMPIPLEGVGAAINDRLQRAAAPRSVDL